MCYCLLKVWVIFPNSSQMYTVSCKFHYFIFFFSWIKIHCAYAPDFHYLFIYWWVSGWTHSLTIVTRAVIKMNMQLHLWSDMKSFGHKPGSGTALVYGTFSFSFVKEPPQWFLYCLSHFHTHWKWTGVPLFSLFSFVIGFLYDNNFNWDKMEFQGSFNFLMATLKMFMCFFFWKLFWNHVSISW